MTDLGARVRTLLVEPLAVPPSVDELRRRVDSRQRHRRRRRLVAGGIAMTLVLGIAGWVVAAAGRHRQTTVVSTGPGTALSPSKLTIFAAARVGPNAGWLLTDQGIYHSDDGGRTWQDVSPYPEVKTFNGARAVAGWEFLDSDHAWIAGIGGGVLNTTDGGKSWPQSAVFLGTAGVVQNLHLSFVTPSTGFASVEMSHQSGAPTDNGIFETTDGGASWTLVNPAAPFDIAGAITFTSPTTGWAVGSVNGLYRTADAGRSWTAQQPGGPTDGRATYSVPRLFGPDGVVEARPTDATGTTIVYVTHDGGRSWARAPLPRDLDVSPYGSGIVPFEAVSATHWLLAAGQKLFVTDDAGASWSERHVSVKVSNLSFIDASTGWAWTTTNECTHTPPCPRDSAMVATFDGGQTWTPIPLPVALTGYHDPVANIALLYPATWQVAAPVLAPSGGTPTQRRELVSVATYPLRSGGETCDQLSVNALDDLGPTDALVSIQELVGAGASTGVPARPSHFGPSQGTEPSGVDQCLTRPGRFTSRVIAFRDPGGSGPHGRVFYALVAIGTAASPQTQTA
ncbi:MAG: hypothetical protein M3256_23450, partial [Actinomycetota bacterium]|nr:hypothetical protein [Actinomycetota bacterium]